MGPPMHGASGNPPTLGQRWKAMRTIGELIAIVPVIMNLKGNLQVGSFMCFLVVLCRHCGRTQVRVTIATSQSDRTSSDSMALPVTSFLGDLVT